MRKLVVAGLDARDMHLAVLARQQGFQVWTWGMAVDGLPDVGEHGFPVGASLVGPVTGIDPQGAMVTRQLVEAVIDDAVLTTMDEAGFLAAGVVGESVRVKAAARGMRVVEYRDSEYFAWQNAVLTVEGALQPAISASGYGLFNRPIGVIGYGRVGRLLCQRLQCFGAILTVFDGDRRHRAQSMAQGFTTYSLFPPEFDHLDLLFNTIPFPVITPAWERLLTDTVVFELASHPGGVAPEVDRTRLSLRSLPGLPGLVAPRRAAEIIWETITGG